MKIFYSLLLIFFSLKCASQNTSGIAVYKIIIDTNESLWNIDKNITPELKQLLQNIEKSALTLEPKLIFNPENAEFSINKSNLNVSQLQSSNFVCNCYNPIYTKLLKKENLKFNNPFKHLGIKEGQYLITDSLKTKWKLFNETKIINNYKCYKATILEEMSNGKTKVVTAWYCPEIPVSVGPKGYGGLPGLIFELQDKNVVFGIKEINFFNPVNIILPDIDKAIRISSIDFNKLIAKRSKENEDYSESLEEKK